VDNRAFESVLRLSAALASREGKAVADALAAAAAVAPARAVEEVLLQSHLFIGFPDVLNAFAVWRELSPSASLSAPVPDEEGWSERGAATCALVYGSNYDKLRGNVRSLHPALDRWMVTGGYGRVLSRPQLALVIRELCIVSLLIPWRTPRQLHSHLRGALNAGATAGQLNSAVDAGCGYLKPREAVQVRALAAEVAGGAAAAGGARTAAPARRQLHERKAGRA
jgi:4-carboxymuconolactone decarboxylase